MTTMTFARLALAVSTIFALSGQARAADLLIGPSDSIILNPTNPGKNYYDTVVHSIAIAAEPGEVVTLRSLEISFRLKGNPVLTKSVPVERIVGETGEIGQMAGAGLGAMVNAQVLNENGLSGLFGRDVTFALTAKLAANEALLTTRHHFSLDVAADEVVVTAELVKANGKVESLQESVSVRPYQSQLVYSSPLDGVWLKTAGASIQGHHRLNPGTEFAVDFFKLDASGQIHNGSSEVAENYFGFGAPVMAAADGEVVFVIWDDLQERALMRPQEGESRSDASRRISRRSFQNMTKDFPRAVAGNIVVLRHGQGDHIEYSSYGHLASGSVNVVLGQKVKRGEVIAKVGDTGDSITVHLHFQINAGASPFTSKSLPVTFDNLKEVNRGVDPLRFVSGG